MIANTVIFKYVIWLFALYFQTDALSRAYPNFVNYFEKAKEAIQDCEKSKPRFHAFLRVIEVAMLMFSVCL